LPAAPQASAHNRSNGSTAFRLEAALHAAYLACTPTRQACRLDRSQRAGEDLAHDLENIAFGLAHDDPVGG
jgi:hypothetical protein